jgi:hypothetical protein
VSGDVTDPIAVERALEGSDAVLHAASVFSMDARKADEMRSVNVRGTDIVLGNLALTTAIRGLPVTKLALWEPNFLVDESRPAPPDDYVAQLEERIGSGRRGDAVEYFLTAAVGLPPEFVAPMREAPMWPGMEEVAHTLAYDALPNGRIRLTRSRRLARSRRGLRRCRRERARM